MASQHSSLGEMSLRIRHMAPFLAQYDFTNKVLDFIGYTLLGFLRYESWRFGNYMDRDLRQ
jgi:hypothetical protein